MVMSSWHRPSSSLVSPLSSRPKTTATGFDAASSNSSGAIPLDVELAWRDFPSRRVVPTT